MSTRGLPLLMRGLAGTVACMVATRGAAADWSLAEALAAAPDGATITVPSGVHPGPIVIDRPVTLVADGAAIFDGGGSGDVVRILAPDVTIRGFLIRNTGASLDRENAGITVLAPRATIEDNTLEDVLFGIYLKDAGSSIIRGNRIGGKRVAIARRGDGIRLWYSPDAVIEDNVVHQSRDVVMWFSRGTRIRRNQVTDGRYGLHFMYSDDNVLEDNRLEGNSVGAFLMYSRNLVLRRNIFLRNRGPSGYGVGLKDMDRILAEENLLLGNRVGVYLD
ncbi:MAG: NosD domain-containing protein, partial [Planctomycetota bacterium]